MRDKHAQYTDYCKFTANGPIRMDPPAAVNGITVRTVLIITVLIILLSSIAYYAIGF